MEKVDAAIIGAGVVGLAIAYSLSRQKDWSVAVVERNTTYGQETSSRNSQVIHSGIYYPARMLKTQLCIEGRHKLYDFCQKHRVPHNRLGKIVLTGRTHAEYLEKLRLQGVDNGVNVRFLSELELKNMEPSLQAGAAFLAPDSGIIDAMELMQRLYLLCRDQGVIFNFYSKLLAIHYSGQDYTLVTNRDRFQAVRVINSAGLGCDAVAALLGLDLDKHRYRLQYVKGEYFSLRNHQKINHLVYPLPDKYGLGIHITPDINGRLRLGPNAYPVELLDYSVDDKHRMEFYQAAHTYLPGISPADLSPDFAGIRPRLKEPGPSGLDFLIKEESSEGYPQFINLIGIESPGLTSCLAIAEYVAGLTQ